MFSFHVYNTKMSDSKYHYAGLWPRFLALFIDFLLFCALFFPVTRLVKGVWLMSPADHKWNYGYIITDPLCIAFLILCNQEKPSRVSL